MKHRYIAKVYFEDGQILENTSNDLEELTKWMSDQAEATFNDIKGEILDIHSNRVVKSIQYSPPNE